MRRYEETERHVIGWLLENHDRTAEILPRLKPGMFHGDARRVYEAIAGLAREGRSSDTLAVSEALERDTGRSGWLVELGRYQAVTLLNIDERIDALTTAYANELAIKWAERVATRLRREDASPENIASQMRVAADMLDSMVPRAGDDQPLGAVALDALIKSTEAARDPIRSGVAELDRLTGAMARGSYYIVAAEPGVGKSALALSYALHTAPSGGVLYLSTEMTKEAILIRALAKLSQVSREQYVRGNLDSVRIDAMERATQELDALKLEVIDGVITIDQVEAETRRLNAQKGLRLVIVDYIQELGFEGDRTDKAVERIGTVSLRLKNLALAEGVTVLACSQVTQLATAEGKNTALYGSRQLTQNASHVLQLAREGSDDMRSHHDLKATMTKARDGRIGSQNLRFYGATYTFVAGR